MNKLNNMQFNFSKLNTPIQFYEMKSTSNNGMPTKPTPELYYECFAHIESVTLRDYQTAVQTNTQNEIKVFIRDYQGIDNKMQIEFNNQMHNIKSIMPNYRDSNFTVIVAEAVSQ